MLGSVAKFATSFAGKSVVDQARAGPPDLSLDRLANDLVALLKTMFPVRAEAPSLVLVGHSMVSLAGGWAG